MSASRSFLFSILLGLFSVLGGCAHSNGADPLPAGAVFVDVRTEAEFASGHLDGAMNVPLDRIDSLPSRVSGKSAEIVVYCRSGARAGKAKVRLTEMGYSNVTNGGGLSDVEKATGKPVVTGK